MITESLLALVIPLSIFAFTSSATPGPNNILLTASGANFGLRRSIPHIMGIRFGFTALQILVAAGLGSLFIAYPMMHHILKYVGAAYLLFLAWKISQMSSPNSRDENNESKIQPMSMWQASLFQFINPKAWIIVISATTAFTLSGDQFLASAILSLIVFNALGIPASLIWVLFGSAISKVLTTDRAWKRFNYSMAAITACSVAFLFI